MSKNQSASGLINVINYDSNGNISFVSGSTTLMQVSSSGAVTVTGVISGSSAQSASLAQNSNLLQGTGSVGFTTTGSFTTMSSSLSSRTTQIENVYATTGSNSFRATQSITGSLTVTGQIIAQTINVQQVTSSIIYSSGSNVFGCDINSRQTFTGSFYQTGSSAIFSNQVCSLMGNFSCLGIGTTAPLGSATEKTIHLSDSGCGYATVYVTNNTNTVKSILAIASASNLGYVGMQSNSDFQLRTNDVERMRVACNGAISIGTITPKYDWYTQSYIGLQINGSTTVWGRGSDSHFSSNYYVKCCSTNGVASDTYIANGYANDLWFDNNAGQLRYRVGACGTSDTSISWTTPFQICPNGYTSINTTADGFAMLCLVATGGDAGIYLRGGSTNTGGWTIQAQNACNLVIVDRTAGSNPVRMQMFSGGVTCFACQICAPVASFKNTGQYNSVLVDNGCAQGGGGYVVQQNGVPAGGVGVSAWWEGGTSCDMGVAAYASRGIRFYTDGGSEKMRITSGGNVGIGTTCNSVRLFVQDFNPANCFCSLTVFGNSNGSDRLHIKDEDGTNQNPTGIWTATGYGTGIYNCSAGATAGIKFFTGAPLTQKAIINAGGCVGIGTIAPNNRLEVQKTGAGAAAIFINQCSSDEATIRFKSTHNTNSDYRVGASILYNAAFEVYSVNCAVDRFWISQCGGVMIGTGADSAVDSYDHVHKIGNVGAGTSYARLMMQERSGCWISFNNGGGTNYGVIQRDGGSGVTYGSNSDYRLKTNVQNMTSACGLSRIMCLRPVLFDWIAECKHGEGFIAHELQDIIPNAVSGKKDAISCETGCPLYQNVDTRNIVPSLVKAIQEQQCKIALLETCLGIS